MHPHRLPFIPGACLAGVIAGLAAEDLQPRRPEPFIPFHYRATIEQLQATASEPMMAAADGARQEMERVNAAGPWKPTWESIDQRAVPEWFADAKLGVFIDWGPWSVAGWAPRKPSGAAYPDWYEKEMLPGGKCHDYHLKTWGADVRRDDLLPLLTGSELDAGALVRLAKDCGARYVVPFARHHVGWTMWDSAYTRRNAVEMGPRRDVYRALADACRDQGMKLGLYFSVAEWDYPVILPDGTLGDCRWGTVDPHFDSAAMNGMCSGKIPVRDYVGQYLMPLFKEAVDAFNPDLVWYDGEWNVPTETWRTRDMAAYYFNRAASRGQEVTINDRYGDKTRRHHGGGFYTSEFHEVKEAQPRVWEECRSISQSYGYNWEDTEANVLSTAELLRTFVRIVADNGNFLLILNPTGSGRLPAIQERRFRDLGAWLAVNGEAIHGSRPLAPHHQDAVYFTRSKDARTAYAICTVWPGKELLLKGLNAADGATLTLLGSSLALPWRRVDGGLAITLPEALQDETARPCRHAWTIRIPQTAR